MIVEVKVELCESLRNTLISVAKTIRAAKRHIRRPDESIATYGPRLEHGRDGIMLRYRLAVREKKNTVWDLEPATLGKKFYD